MDLPSRDKLRSNPGDEGAHPDDVASLAAAKGAIKIENASRATPDKDHNDQELGRHSDH